MKSLFKYRADIGNHSFDILENDRFYFCAPEYFNDPFDAAIPFDYSKVSSGYLKSMVKRNSKNMIGDRESRRKKGKELHKRMVSAKSNFGSRGYQAQIDFINKNIGIFCLSSESKNLLLWAHYANSHRGFCIEFDKEKLIRYINEENRNTLYGQKSLLQFEQVIYSKTFPLINPETFSEPDKFTQPLITKSIDWKYEEEFRIIYLKGANRHYEIDDSIISGVYLGLKASADTEKHIKQCLEKRKSKIPLFKAKMKQKEYALEFVKI